MQNSNSPEIGAYVGYGILGFLAGGMIGFLARPSIPLFGKLPFEIVITAGANLKGMDSLLKGIAQQSFLIMLIGAIIGAFVCVFIVNLVLSRRTTISRELSDYQQDSISAKPHSKNGSQIDQETRAVIEGYELKIAQDPLKPDSILELANFLIEKRLFDKAIPTLLKHITIDNKNIAALMLLMDCYEKVERYEDAINIGKKILEANDTDIDILNKIADIYYKLDKTENMLKYLNIITENDPNNLKAWLKKAETYESIGNNDESLKAWQNVNRIDPRNSIANLKLAINMADAGNYRQAISVFNKILNDFDKYDVNSETLDIYLLWCSIISDDKIAEKDIENLMKNIPINELDHLPIANKNLLSNIYEFYGNNELALEKYDSAINHFKKAYDKRPSEDIKKKLAQTYLKEGTFYFSKKIFASAIFCFQEGLIYDPDNVQLEEKLSTVLSKRKRKKVLRFSFATAILMLIGVSYGLYYLSYESFNITVNTKANISVIREKDLFSSLIKKNIIKEIIEDTIILNETKYLNTGYLFYGTYQIKAEKIGYEKFEKTVKTGLGRKQKNIHAELKPLLGSIKVDSDPRNAAVIVKNGYQVKRDKTPCEIKNLFALDSEISVSLPGFNSYKIIKKIPINDRLDLGIISFEGSLLIDSIPTDAYVYVDKKNIGKTPIKIDKLPAKKITIEIIKKNIGSYISHIEVLPNQEIDLGAVKLSNLCSLNVHSKPARATALLDGNIVGKTPLLLSKLKSGRHKLTLKLNGYTPYEKELFLKPGENKKISETSLHSWLNKPLKQIRRWKAKIQIKSLEEGKICGSIDFISLNCGGNLVYYKEYNNGFLFKENLNYGRCVKGCLIWINEDGSFYEEICRNKRTGFGRLYFDKKTKEPENFADIGGYWELWREKKLKKDPINWMKITTFGPNISVYGNSWTGEGIFSNNKGYYNWKLKTGQTGQTELFIDKNGRLHGKVRGGGANWNYVAKIAK